MKGGEKTEEKLAELLDQQEKAELEDETRQRQASEQLAWQLEQEDDAATAAAASALQKKKASAEKPENINAPTHKDDKEEDIPQSEKDALMDLAKSKVLGKCAPQERIANYSSDEEAADGTESDEQIALRLQAEEDERQKEVLSSRCSSLVRVW